MIKPKFEGFDYGEERKDLSWFQYTKQLNVWCNHIWSNTGSQSQGLFVMVCIKCGTTKKIKL